MIVGRSSGFFGRVQQRLGRRWGTTFYTPRQLEEELSEAGFISFTSVPHRVTLLFRALKKDVSGPARDG
jgi:hypothetical protein